jgi:hypothetical protein
VPGTVLNPEDVIVNEMGTFPPLHAIRKERT